MSVYTVEATAETTADPVSLRFQEQKFRLEANAGKWFGSRELELPDNVSISFRASGLLMTAWKLTIVFKDQQGAAKTYEKDGSTPANQLSILNDTFSLR